MHGLAGKIDAFVKNAKRSTRQLRIVIFQKVQSQRDCIVRFDDCNKEKITNFRTVIRIGAHKITSRDFRHK